MSTNESESQYYIFMDVDYKLYALGIDGRYETDISKAISFNNKIDAFIYVEKHGYERMAYIRQFNI